VSSELKTRYRNWKAQVSAIKQQYGHIEERANQAREAVQTTKGAIALLQFVAAEISKNNESQTAQLATLALREAFPAEQLTLQLNHTMKRGATGVEFELIDEQRKASGEPLESFGGGPGALLSIVLRIIAVVRHPEMARILILDEPLPQVSVSYAPLTGKLLRKLCEPRERGGLGFKMLVITHMAAIADAAHRRYEAYTCPDDGKTLKLALQEVGTTS